MASWLKVAEDLLEVVDRRAKLVVNELSDEQSDLQPSSSAPNGQEVKARRTKSKTKANSRPSSTEVSKTNLEQQKNIQLSAPDVKVDRVETSTHENSLEDETNQTTETSSEHQADNNNNTIVSDITASGATQIDESEKDIINAKAVPIAHSDIETKNISTEDAATAANSEDVLENSTPTVVGKEIDSPRVNHPADADSKLSTAHEDASLTVEKVKPESETVEKPNVINSQENESDPQPDPSPNLNKQQEIKNETLPKKIQDQLDEAQGLLKSSVSSGQSKEARLARVCAGLSSRLQEYKAENAQLEELLVAEKERCTSYEARVKQLQKDLSASKLEVTRIESNMKAALAAKNAEIESLVGSMDSLKKQASGSEEKLVSLQANMEAIMRNRELTETRMMQALREELASAERRAEEERIAHNATKMAAVEREVELEHRAVEASNALVRIQRAAEESTARATDLEHKVALLEVECASLTQELQDMEARNRRGQKKSSEEASQILQMQAWQEEVERARQGQRDAETKLSSLEAELQKMRVEMAGMKRDAEHYSRQEHMELEKRYRELTDLLYHKQTQLEAMASEKAAAEFQLEKEARRLQEAQVEAERNRVSRRSSAVWEEDTDIKALEPLPLHHRHMAGASVQLQKAAKFLDTGAVRATRFLWRYPVARVLLLFYLVFVHLFLMYLLHRLQEQADDFSSREVAKSMGLGDTSLP
ncbi:golgin-84 isoform X1 [Asparagus officinalis]|uniref:golgin-84 isoform X1 n=1 Tax=Asparagus officinalis TaxID=4686 RepID=UPI00098E85FC|nr:golgin-84 isoform X1 [Asparagus officinalis]